MDTSFSFLKTFDTNKDKLEVIYFEALGTDEILEGEINPITNKPSEGGEFLLDHNIKMKISVNDEPFYVWSFECDDGGEQIWEGEFILISRNKNFKEFERFDCYKLGISIGFPKKSNPNETSLVLCFLRFFIDAMNDQRVDMELIDFEEEIWGEDGIDGVFKASKGGVENLGKGGIDFFKKNPPIDIHCDFDKHYFNWNVIFDKPLMKMINLYRRTL